MDADTAACQKIINAETPFECFELPTEEVDPELVRTLYLKIAVRIHPDKNKSDLATQAFQVYNRCSIWCSIWCLTRQKHVFS